MIALFRICVAARFASVLCAIAILASVFLNQKLILPLAVIACTAGFLQLSGFVILSHFSHEIPGSTATIIRLNRLVVSRFRQAVYSFGAVLYAVAAVAIFRGLIS
ncbi:MAG: hypothetical protein ABIM50_01850 [Novosphingobium sp.]